MKFQYILEKDGEVKTINCLSINDAAATIKRREGKVPYSIWEI